jgi:translation initiation factor 2 subunit 2
MSDFVEPAGDDVPDEVAAMFDLTQKKKKKKSTKSKTDAATEGDGAKEISAEGAAGGDVASSSSAATGVFELDPPNYTYTQLLNRVVDSLQQNNPELTDKKRITMKPPQLMRGNNCAVNPAIPLSCLNAFMLLI